jgi:DNA polymerase I
MPKKIILVDGSNLAFRMFFALSRLTLTSPDGKPSGAIYGFVKLIIETINREKPTNLVVAWDPKGGTFRDKKFSFYKANRQTEIPPDLLEQFPKIFQALDYLGVPQYNITNIEADDIIGTLATRFASKENQVFYLSGDRDLFQLVGNGITAMYPINQGGIALMEAQDVKEKMGVFPNQVVDFKAIAGDSSDNIPGVPGIGVIGATKLLSEYETLENIYENLEKISPVGLQKKLTEGRQSALDSKWLATIKTDCDVNYNLDIPLVNPNLEKLQEFFSYYNLKSLQKPLEVLLKNHGSSGALDFEIEQKPKNELKTEAVEKIVQWQAKKILGQITAKTVAYYISPRDPEYLEISWENQNNYYTTRIKIKESLQELNNFFETFSGDFITYDLKNQYKLFTQLGLFLPKNSGDLFLADKLQNYSEKKNFEDFLASSNLLPGISTTTNFLVIYKALILGFTKKEFKLWQDIESPLALVVGKMEETGIYIDKEKMQDISKELHNEIDRLHEKIHAVLKTPNININSTQQLAATLSEMGFDLGKKGKNGSFSTKRDILENLVLEDKTGLIQDILDYRTVTKLASTFIDSFLKLIHPDGRIHGIYNQIGANTGRFSSTEPNLQNIPIRHPKYGQLIRSTIAAPIGKKIIAADYSQIELRVLAHVSGDPTLIEAFKLDQDIHARTAAEIYNIDLDKVNNEKRRFGKTLNFALVYMQGPFATSKQLGITMKEAKEFTAKYFTTFPKVQPLIEKTLDQASSDLFVETIWGRKIKFPNINSGNFVLKNASRRAAFNAVLQGTGTGDITKIAMNRLQNRIEKEKLPIKILMQIHDELVFEVQDDFAKKAVDVIRQEMMLDNPLDVPLKVDIGIGDNWAACK